MQMKILIAVFASMTLTGAAFAEGRIVLNTIYPVNQDVFVLSEGYYLSQDNQGYYEVIKGPFKDGPARCVGAGFGYSDGTNTIHGICLFGEGDDTFTMRWQAGQKGNENTWTIAAGTGTFQGMTGNGIATTAVEVMLKNTPMRESQIVGTVDIPQN